MAADPGNNSNNTTELPLIPEQTSARSSSTAAATHSFWPLFDLATKGHWGNTLKKAQRQMAGHKGLLGKLIVDKSFSASHIHTYTHTQMID